MCGQALRGSKRYELIMLDAYEHQYIPEHMLTREFLSEVRALLQPGGSWRPIPSPPASCIRTNR
jgi:spermidine synthase